MRERKHPSELQSSPPTRSVGARCSLCSSPWTSRTPPQSLQHDGKHTWMENTTFGPNFQNKTLSRWGLFSPWDEEAVTLILVENSSCFRRYSVRLYAAASKEKKKKKKRSTSKSMCDDEPAAHCGFDPPDLTAEAYRTVPPLCDVSWPIKLSHTHAPPAPAHNNTEHLTRFVSACTNPGGVNQQRDI